jgi:hypothetical protein
MQWASQVHYWLIPSSCCRARSHESKSWIACGFALLQVNSLALVPHIQGVHRYACGGGGGDDDIH